MYLHLNDNPLGALKDGGNENTENLTAGEMHSNIGFWAAVPTGDKVL